MSLDACAAGAATSGDSDVVRTSTRIVANATARGTAEIDPLLINIRSSLVMLVKHKATASWPAEVDRGQPCLSRAIPNCLIIKPLRLCIFGAFSVPSLVGLQTEDVIR